MFCIKNCRYPNMGTRNWNLDSVKVVIRYQRRTFVEDATSDKKRFNHTKDKKYNKNPSLISLFHFINDALNLRNTSCTFYVLCHFIFNDIKHINNHEITENYNYDQHIQHIEDIKDTSDFNCSLKYFQFNRINNNKDRKYFNQYHHT